MTTIAELADRYAPVYLTHSQTAKRLGVSEETLRQGVIKGRFPPPDLPRERRGQPNRWRQSTVDAIAAERRGQIPVSALADLDDLVRGRPYAPWWGGTRTRVGR